MKIWAIGKYFQTIWLDNYLLVLNLYLIGDK
jgi:hypothetical protein